MTALSGAWVSQNTTTPQVPLVPFRDSQHSNPDANPDFANMRPTWANSAPAPDLPQAIMPTEHPPLVAPGGPVDMTPWDHALGPGAGAGLSELSAQDQAAPWHRLDQGDYAARKYIPPVMRVTNPHVAEITDMANQGDSPQTLAYDRTGYGLPNDPAARLAKRQKRWYDFRIDFHRFGVQYRPLRQLRAQGQADTFVPNANQTTPATKSIIGYDPRTPDRFVTPFARRAPSAWDETTVRDGTGQASQPLGAWGL